jgi:hypothetical protein
MWLKSIQQMSEEWEASIQNAFLGFQTSQTFPEIEGASPSLARVGFPGSQPQGMNSPVAWWC